MSQKNDRTYAYLGSYLMRVEALTRNKPVFFQHVVIEKKRTRMLEKYCIWQKPVVDKNTRKMRFDKKHGNMVFQVFLQSSKSMMFAKLSPLFKALT